MSLNRLQCICISPKLTVPVTKCFILSQSFLFLRIGKILSVPVSPQPLFFRNFQENDEIRTKEIFRPDKFRLVSLHSSGLQPMRHRIRGSAVPKSVTPISMRFKSKTFFNWRFPHTCPSQQAAWNSRRPAPPSSCPKSRRPSARTPADCRSSRERPETREASAESKWGSFSVYSKGI